MLNDFVDKIGLLKAFDFEAEMTEIVADNSEVLAELVREQLATGTDGDEEPNVIFGSPNYRPATVAIKEARGEGLGAITAYVTNYMTGAFYESIKFESDGEAFEATSDVPYFADIQEYSTPALLEINAKNRLEFAENVTLPQIKERLLSKANIILTT